MVEPLAVTDEDVHAFWDQLYTTRDYAAVPPQPNDLYDRILLDGIRRGIANDRKRVLETNRYSENRK